MEVLKGLITEFAIFSTPAKPEDEVQFVKGDDSLDDGESQDGDMELSFGQDDGQGNDEDHPEHDPATCSCPCHDAEKAAGGLEDDDNIEVIDGDPESEEASFSLDDSENDDEEEEEDEESKYKLF
jgi:hypothetical protein